jgi:hypothetical protein
MAAPHDDKDGADPSRGDRIKSRKYAMGFSLRIKLSAGTRRGNHMIGERKKRT